MLNINLSVLVNAVIFRREFTLFNRVAIFILLYSGIMGYDSLYITYLDTGIGIFKGLFHSTAITHSFDLLNITNAFYARRIVQPIFPYNRFEPSPPEGMHILPSPGRGKPALRREWIILKRLCESIYSIWISSFYVHIYGNPNVTNIYCFILFDFIYIY
jgi:hypothetical protein